jgi:hypothetical protein
MNRILNRGGSQRPIIDGSTFWNPYEGLGWAADLIKLARSWIEAGVADPSRGTKEEVCASWERMEAATRAIRPHVKAAYQEWVRFRVGKTHAARPVFLRKEDGRVLRTLREQVLCIRATMAIANGAIRLPEAVIEYPKAEVRFTQESYFDFVLRSIDEVVGLEKGGKLNGPASGQRW